MACSMSSPYLMLHQLKEKVVLKMRIKGQIAWLHFIIPFFKTSNMEMTKNDENNLSADIRGFESFIEASDECMEWKLIAQPMIFSTSSKTS